MHDRPRILICDDEPRITASIKALLEAGNYQIQTTNSSRHAVSLIQAEAPDLVILDVMMPELTGFDVLDEVDRDAADTAFIMVTGETSIDTAIKAIRKGAVDYLRKPFEPDELIIRVENVLKQRQLQQEQKTIEAENRELEHQLRQSQKMEAIGTLAGGIAHDFNNVLSIILGNAELAMTILPRENGCYQNLEQIFEASLRAREMIKQLLSFSRKEESGKKPVRLNSVISESLKLLRASLPTNIVIERELTTDDCIVIADATQIHQVMLNLCTNSAHAMERQGGVLGIRLRQMVLDAASGAGLDLPPGPYARLAVSDTGCGIDKSILERIFDPYFTTKEVGRGTGMGLSVVHGIVKAGGGAIRVQSEPGRGAEFHIYLPRADAIAINESPTFDRRQLPGGHEHIMIVDDEDMLIWMMRQTLEQLGYRVSAFTESPAALKAFMQNPNAFDMLITDMTMPGMTGTGLVRAIRQTRKDLPVILCTGYNEHVNQDNAQAMGIQALIMKPIGMQQLAKTIRNLLAPVSSDRRRSPRFRAPMGAYVISRNNPHLRLKLMDIGMTGLAYCHGDGLDDINELDSLSLMIPGGEFFISGINCRHVSEKLLAAEAHAHEERVRRGVHFEGLSMMQTELLTQFIHTHATELLH